MLFIIAERYGRSSAVARVLGAVYLLHSLYILLDLGNGGLFLLPLPLVLLRVAEEFVELSYLAAYLAGFALVYGGQIAAARRGRAGA